MVSIIGRTSAFRRDHWRPEGGIGRAGIAEFRTITGRQSPRENVARSATQTIVSVVCRLWTRQVETLMRIEFCKVLPEPVSASGNDPQTSPRSISNFINRFDYTQSCWIPKLLNRSSVAVLNL